MKKLIILFVLLATIAACKPRQKFVLLNGTEMMLVSDPEADGYHLYDYKTKDTFYDLLDTAYVWQHQIIGVRGDNKFIYNTSGTFYVSSDEIYVFETYTDGPFYIVAYQHGFKWYTKTGREMYFVQPERLRDILRVAIKVDDAPYCYFLLEEKYYPWN